ncbi:unnamed protein product [Darwinula stevensoni]|uniref:C2H2-type domain-containing protein n=1 Tax=Darwinula stevensoni TaxID=69355 RepID=A0A7R8X3C4_9CRUS|nr:unnamed protein product [Darwinula stevensoni]CAG0878552.1 unnamed protein product [Darwinula stevensoni]
MNCEPSAQFFSTPSISPSQKLSSSHGDSPTEPEEYGKRGEDTSTKRFPWLASSEETSEEGICQDLLFGDPYGICFYSSIFGEKWTTINAWNAKDLLCSNADSVQSNSMDGPLTRPKGGRTRNRDQVAVVSKTKDPINAKLEDMEMVAGKLRLNNYFQSHDDHVFKYDSGGSFFEVQLGDEVEVSTDESFLIPGGMKPLNQAIEDDPGPIIVSTLEVPESAPEVIISDDNRCNGDDKENLPLHQIDLTKLDTISLTQGSNLEPKPKRMHRRIFFTDVQSRSKRARTKFFQVKDSLLPPTILSSYNSMHDPIVTSNGNLFPCKYCAKVYTTASARNRHNNKYHQVTPKYQCCHCEWVFDRAKYLKIHYRTYATCHDFAVQHGFHIKYIT